MWKYRIKNRTFLHIKFRRDDCENILYNYIFNNISGMDNCSCLWYCWLFDSKRCPDLHCCDIKIPIICFVQVLIHIIILIFVNVFSLRQLLTIYLSCVAFYFLFLFLLNMIMFKFPTPNADGGECWHFSIPFLVFFILLMIMKFI